MTSLIDFLASLFVFIAIVAVGAVGFEGKTLAKGRVVACILFMMGAAWVLARFWSL